MYQSLGGITLKSGETVEAAHLIGPEPAWAPRIVDMLSHKGDPWNWQNAQVLERDLGIDVHFYVLHRDGDPFANMMTIELAGVGHFGHVWTRPEDRQQGASSALMALQMEDFRQRSGRALFLSTGYNSVPYRLYEKFGFQGFSPPSGYMAYYRTTHDDFDADYFRAAPAVIKPLNWTHWPASAPLFLGDFPGIVRAAGAHLIGIATTESPFLDLLHDVERRQQRQRSSRVSILQSATTAVVGCALWSWHPIWPETCLVDLYCHPGYWRQAGDLLNALELPDADSFMAYGDSTAPERMAVLQHAGFKQSSILPQRVSGLEEGREDIIVVER